MKSEKRQRAFKGLRITSLGTLASRILGMLRDVATASLFGLSGGGVMDAFVVAFRIPNLFRRMFGEGALTAGYLPLLAEKLEQDKKLAWQFASVILTLLTVLLLGILLVAEAIVWLVYLAWGDAPGMSLLLGLTATMLPYMVVICIAAILAATLYGVHDFTSPALAPILLNIVWLVAVLLVAPRLTSDKQTQIYILAVAIVLAGGLQLVVHLPALYRAGFRYDFNWQSSRAAVVRVGKSLLPMMFGLAITQLNSLFDSLFAWGLAASPESGAMISWLPAVAYPMQQGAAAATFYGERLYQFPLGILGVAVATVIFPLLSRHAARGETKRIGRDMTLGLQLIIFLAVPASLGLTLLAEPITRLLFEYGEFSPQATVRTARVIACYGAGVWAFCGVPVIVRGYYALGDYRTPVKLGVWMVLFNIFVNILLVWPFAEAGLALTTTLSATIQIVLLAVLFSRNCSPLDWQELRSCVVRSGIGTVAMGSACFGVLSLLWSQLAGHSPQSVLMRGVLVAVPFVVSVIVYLGFTWLIGSREFLLLLGREKKENSREK